jgi:MFS family permease
MLGAFVIGIITGENLGVVTANVLLGFVGGFGVGTLGGMLLMALGRRFRADFRIRAGILSFLLGAAIGAVVTLLLEDRKWIPLGAGIGAVGATLWPVLFRRLEAKLNPPTPVTFNEDPFPEEREKSRRYSI